MKYYCRYDAPKGLDGLFIESDGINLTRLFFDRPGEKISGVAVRPCDVGVIKETFEWLDAYFSGDPKKTVPKLRFEGLTPFQNAVLSIIRNIPFGKSVSYGELSRLVAQKTGKEKMSAQAIGGALKRNPVCIIIPCHRIIGKDGSLTGYSGGIENKRRLLEHEGIYINK